MFRSTTQDERRMFRRAVQAQREGCSGELYRHRVRDVQESFIVQSQRRMFRRAVQAKRGVFSD
jgi:hypothetical protein